MSRAPHPLLDGLYAQAGTAGLMMQREQQTKLMLKTIEVSLRLTGLGGGELIAGLLQAPLAEPGSVGPLEAALAGVDSPVQAMVEQLASAVAAPSASTRAGAVAGRAVAPSAPGHAPARAALKASAVQTPGAALAKPAAGMPARRSTQGIGALPRTNADALGGDMFPPAMLAALTAVAAGTPVGGNSVDMVPILAAMTKSLGAAGGPNMRPVRRQAPSLPLALQTILEPALPLLHAALNRISGRDGTAPAAHVGTTARGRTPTSEPLADLAPALEWAGRIFGPSARQVASALHLAPAEPPAAWAAASAGAMGGLRGLAARSAPAARTAPAGSNVAHLTAPQAQRQQPNPADVPVPMVVTTAPLDDEHLARQLTRVLWREAQRDGVDLSDLQP